ncbi:MAG: bifunctional aspartate kinase/homoserine dehydrogenase I [Bacteroidales bacterium]|nr:bifunctional aspartate kinase/homoserine dehydrogenase I [Bacteroidales bacterium]
MKVLKFGGSSVGTAESLKHVKQIVESRQEPVVVVVSALKGVTDKLINTARLAEAGDASYADHVQAIRDLHESLVDEVFGETPAKISLLGELIPMLDRLGELYRGVCLLGDLSDRSLDEIVSYGERLSSRIVTALLDGARRYNALDFIRTVRKAGQNTLDDAATYPLVRQALGNFSGQTRIAVVPGFIAVDSATGRITNLGRGGSDYTASIIASALDAELLEIWTDVDGFMTADPHIIQTSYVIEELSYEEAMELCNFGAKVIYPPTLYPVFAKNIPIAVRNTFRPDAPGTIIKSDVRRPDTTITGISSIDDTCLITLSAPSMVGLIGIDSRLFTALSSHDISVFMACQSSSETGISIGVMKKDARLACEVIDQEFAGEIAMGAMHKASLIADLATVAIVGENMKRNPGTAGKLFSTLGRNGISIIACAQGASESNISFAIERKFLRKALNVIHDSFFLSEYQELNLFVCGVGTVGAQLLEQIASQRERLMQRRGLKINVVGIARSTKGVFDRNGIDLSGWRDALAQGKPLDLPALRDEVIGMNIFNAVFVDCTASADVAAMYEDFFNHSISVVAANKIAASSDYSLYRKLKETARKRGVKFLFETNVGAGLPIINTINDLRNSGDHIEKIEAVLSGTLNFIFNTISADIPFSQTVRLAMEGGYSEPDPRIDLSGKDVIRKLVILSREAGYEVNQEDVEANLFIPKEFFDCSMEEFWEKLPSLDADFEARRREIEARHERWRFVAKMEDGKYSVSLRTVDEHHSFYVLDGSNNIVLLTTERYHQHPMLIQGYGAGASVTAAGVFADIMSIANI